MTNPREDGNIVNVKEILKQKLEGLIHR
jgi:hypothetical protein